MKMVDIQQINRELVCDPAGFARQANAAYDAQIEAATCARAVTSTRSCCSPARPAAARPPPP